MFHTFTLVAMNVVVRPVEQFCAATPLKICINLCVPSCFSLAAPAQLAARCSDYK